MSVYDAPKILEREEIDALLDLTLTYGETYTGRLHALRDHTLMTLALAMGLRSHELSALVVGRVYDAQGRARESIDLTVYKGAARFDHKPQTVFVPATARETLEAFYRLKHDAGESLAPDAPLFLSQKGSALSTRQMRRMFGEWQARAGLTNGRTFHALRHTACTAVYEHSRGDLKATQDFARHRDISTTGIYVHARRRAVKRAADNAAAAWAPSKRKRSAR